MKPLAIVLLLYCLFLRSFMWAQEETHSIGIHIPEVALLAVRSSTNSAIKLQGTAPSEAGVAVVFTDVNKDMWINYSSIVGSVSEPTRTISVQLTDGKVPKGLKLSVMVGSDVGKGGGALGKPILRNLRISHRSKMIIKAIGSSYTGKGALKGHNLKYSLSLVNKKNRYAKLDFDASTLLSVTYTLSDN